MLSVLIKSMSVTRILILTTALICCSSLWYIEHGPHFPFWILALLFLQTFMLGRNRSGPPIAPSDRPRSLRTTLAVILSITIVGGLSLGIWLAYLSQHHH